MLLLTPLSISLQTITLLITCTLNLPHLTEALSLSNPEVKRILQNLLSISTHLQNPDLYSTSWANNVAVTSSNSIIASRNVKEGELLTLYPVNAIGIKSNLNGKNDNQKNNKGMGGGNKVKMSKKQAMKALINENKCNFLESYDYLYHDSKWNFDDTVPNMKSYQHEVSLSLPLLSLTTSPTFGIKSVLSENLNSLYMQSHPNRKILPGWYGHLIETKLTQDSMRKSLDIQRVLAQNCILVPIPCSLPLCAIVATRDIEKGEKIIRQVYDNSIIDERDEEDKAVKKFAKWIVRRYTSEISELSSYCEMAYVQSNHDVDNEIQSQEKDNNEDEDSSFPTNLFHSINESYPNITKLNSNPDIYMIPDFLTPDECDQLVDKASLHLKPCLIKSQESGTVQMDPNIRTSTNANIPRAEVPSITQKIIQLTNCAEEQLEIFQVLKYEKGQEFKSHTDGFETPVTACGFFHSGRIVTLFTYLNDVQDGGKTSFVKLGLDITPKKGMAVVHFPMTIDLVEDKRTEHQGSMAIDEKWILTAWVWKYERLDERYSEEKLQTLSSNLI